MFGRRGRIAGSIFTTGPTSTICQSGRASAIASSSARSNRSSITPKKPSRGCGRPAWSAASGDGPGARLPKVGGVHAAGEAVHVGVAVLLGPVQARPAGEHHVGALEQLRPRAAAVAAGRLERRQLVHAVVNRAAGPSACASGSAIGVYNQATRVDHPARWRTRLPARPAPGAGRDGTREPDRGMGPEYGEVRLRRRAIPAGRSLSVKLWLFDEKNRPFGGQAGEQMLRALIYEIPAKMRESDNRVPRLHEVLVG